ncbi:akt-1, partial [Symbiodinium natans]
QGEVAPIRRTCSTQMEQSQPRRPTTPVEATEIFGKVLKDSSSRFLVSSKGSDSSDSNLTGFLFSTGVGERMAEVLEADQRLAEEQPVQLTALRTQGVLGAGAFGKVFKVQDVASAEVYALKLQRRDRASKFAIREAQALHRSSHAFIVRLIHIFQTQSYYALLMELCDKSLNACILDHVSSSGRVEGLPEDVARRYAACITLALDYLHQQKVVFRDLKPDNVLVTFQDNLAKLADFGLARSLDPSFLDKGADPDSDNDEKALSPYSSTVCGTPRFMAPEVYDEPKFIDSEDDEAEEHAIKRVLSRDWYALGCCLLLMLLGQDGGSLAEMKGRRVLLPPSGQPEITCSLRKASKKGLIDEYALHLIDALTAPVEARASAAEVRVQPFMKAAIIEMEKFAGHIADTRS